ncbi:MAG: CdvA-like protein [Candidatus Nitrosocosmicus sp.]
MSELKLEFVGKKAKDMYGTYIGKVIGIVTDVDGSIESVSVDCGSAGIKNLPYEQLLVQGDYVIFIPKWRLDAQKLLREKSMALKRIKALQEIVSENDNMKDDAELAYLKYEKRLDKLNENTTEIVERLHQRISELDIESKRIKAVLFDAKLQYKSNEITEEIYQQIGLNTNDLLDHINLEKTEIKNIMNRFTQQTLENTVTSAPSTAEASLSSNETQETTTLNNHQGENNEVLLDNNQITTTTTTHYADTTNNGESQGQIRQEEEEEIEVKKEIEDSIEVISDAANNNQNEHTEVNPMITSSAS